MSNPTSRQVYICRKRCANHSQGKMATMPNVWLSLATVILATMHGIPATANREHKVHNIVLYPNKQSWCTTRNISQVITEPGCKQVTIDNNVCVGACFSYSIPHTEPSDPGEIIGPYCDSCQPSDVSYVFVKVDCTENANMKNPYLYKQVQLIHNCTCTACDEQSTHRSTPTSNTRDLSDGSQEHGLGSGEQLHHHQASLVLDKDQDMIPIEHQPHRVPSHTKHSAGGVSVGSDETPADSDMIQDDIPEILEVVHYSENDTEPIRHTPVHDLQSPNSGTTYMEQQQLNHYEHNSHTDNVKKLLHQKIVKLLRSIEETNSQSDREQLIEMIRLIKGTSDRNWDELVESLQSENSILDFNRLRSELVEDEPLNVPSFGGTEAVDTGEEAGKQHADPESAESLARKKHSSTPEYADHQRLMQHQYDTLRHRANHLHEHASTGSKETIGDADKSTQESHTPAETGTPVRSHHHAHQHHLVGERIDAHHHLGRGPHGALVIQADRDDLEIHRSIQNGHEIKEKIHIQAHELKPNHAGTVVTYDGHVPVPTVTSDVGSVSVGETENRGHHFQTPHMHPRQHAQGHGGHHNAMRGHGHHENDRHGHHNHDHTNADHGSHPSKPHAAASVTVGDIEQ
ncbi:uncharacterized protein LOC125771024 isoform X2 [Anopheles funestus]|uniref:uncharacterized protein LOC125771024 isoform X2 n=1 Tax=Anopheles funestus TaxID=62324 RepID=UPI0020C62785|nr:uncharacterized protein LOC125771024 isoform X2 [Anopheles funestus]XP_049297183.1 uncharacterized protein LOC125771024 isoform X2 [Anopheles funestus]